MALAGVMLIGVGIVNLSYGEAHFIDATAHGVLAAITMAISVYADWKDGHKMMIVYACVLIIACAIVTFTQKFEVFEPFGVCVVMAWAFGQSVKMLNEAKAAEAQTAQ